MDTQPLFSMVRVIFYRGQVEVWPMLGLAIIDLLVCWLCWLTDGVSFKGLQTKGALLYWQIEFLGSDCTLWGRDMSKLERARFEGQAKLQWRWTELGRILSCSLQNRKSLKYEMHRVQRSRENKRKKKKKKTGHQLLVEEINKREGNDVSEWATMQ